MPHSSLPAATTDHRGPARTGYRLITAISMTAGRGPAARTIAALAGLSPQDKVVDIGCGPGTAARTAAGRCASVTGVDPAPEMLRLGRWITAARRITNVTLTEGRAEALPLPDASVTVAWALSSVHHWPDRAAGLAEAARVLAPAGRILLAERLVKPGARGHAGHGLSLEQAGHLAADLTAAGFTGVSCDTRQAGRRALLIIRATLPGAAGLTHPDAAAGLTEAARDSSGFRRGDLECRRTCDRRSAVAG
jgi:SAM-dependent methyltransferase